ncbi:hypothetical protein [Bacillus atrophaeus]|uniref:hypothetical protein n=1 Tax=Bacillus atrophaeus TaxID=1452 RepID=UPI001156F41B|nr:hypothetical protein [Bacillus atrophaeus]
MDEWWGVTLTGDEKAVKSLSELIDVNKTLFENLYKVKTDTIEELVNILDNQVPEHEKQFLNYVREQLPNLRRYLQFKLPSNPQLISSVEYEIYITGAEMDCEYPDDARGRIISFFNHTPELIDLYKEGFSAE